MRLIDADALRGEYERIYKKHYAKSVYRFVHDTFRAVFKRIDNAPTIEAEPVRHGYWMCGDYYDIGDVCSECDWDSLVSPCDYRYCPNCGCKMSKEK